MNDHITAELRGLLRGALAATEKARDMAGDTKRPLALAAIGKAGLALLAAVARLEDEQATPVADIGIASNARRIER